MIVQDVLIIGGGAAGLFCAIEAGKRGRRVTVVEHREQVGKKILISGGGRCNFTNMHTSAENFLSENPHFCKSALARYTPWDFVGLVERHGISYHEKELGQLFCDLSARQIVKMLTDECQDAGVRIEVNCKVESVEKSGSGFNVETGLGTIQATSLVVATGGLSIPKMGATGFGLELATQYGLEIIPTRAALVPLTFDEKTLAEYRDLSGIALPVEVRCHEGCFTGGMLFTHRGISGPSILQISSYWKSGDELRMNLLPRLDVNVWLAERRRERPAAELKTVLAEALPNRLAQRIGEAFSGGTRPVRQFRETELREIAETIQQWSFLPAGTEGYRTAEVMLGGVNTNELSSTTLASKKVPGLYFIGEVVDVTGHLGGFNFQWAWASGYAAGQVV
ncbi:MAG: NAD(P)/FAD-dependent oxidoreductase [Isosphaeraceae bacterium]